MTGLVTLFGGGGFLGRYVAQALLAAGARVRVAEREPGDAFFVKPLGGLGQTQFVAADVRKPESVRHAVSGADAVVNLVGLLSGDFKAVHVEGARHIAEAARAAGARALIQISAIGADPASPSAYGRTKGEGEIAVRDAFAEATIIRPSLLFGQEDQFINRFARMARLLPALPVIRPQVKLQPAWVADVGKAIASAALDPAVHAGRTYELGGPQVFTMADLLRWLVQAIGHKRELIMVPDGIAAAIARMGWLPGAPITWDQWLMLQRDNVMAPDAAGFEAFGLNPAPLAAITPAWLVQYRRHGRFAARPTA